MPTERPSPGPHVEIYPDAAGEVRWRLLSPNGAVVLPQEGHRDEHDARRAMLTAAHLLALAVTADAIEVEGAPVDNAGALSEEALAAEVEDAYAKPAAEPETGELGQDAGATGHEGPA